MVFESKLSASSAGELVLNRAVRAEGNIFMAKRDSRPHLSNRSETKNRQNFSESLWRASGRIGRNFGRSGWCASPSRACSR
jgi:hypothetical protein